MEKGVEPDAHERANAKARDGESDLFASSSTSNKDFIEIGL